MAEIAPLFVTRLYRAELKELGKKKVDYEELKAACEAIADDDEAGQEWCEANGYPGYTSYAFGDFRHDLCLDAQGHFGVEIGRPPPANDDAFPLAVEEGRAGIAKLCLCEAQRWRCAAVGKLAAPRSADEHGRRRTHLGQLQLRVGVGVERG